MRIGVFDSGLGGLAILSSIVAELPEYDYIYLGDNAHVPYGGKSPEQIYQLTEKAVRFLFEKDCQLIILACNTASAIALRKLQQEFLPNNYPDRKILGIIRPTVETIIDCGYKKVGLIGTHATVDSKYFEEELYERDPSLKLYQNPAPLLVPIIEEGKFNSESLRPVLEEYLKPLLKEGIEALVLGCTHYSLIADGIKKIAGTSVTVIQEGKVMGGKLKTYLANHQEYNKILDKNGRRTFYVTNSCQRYEDLLNRFMGKEIGFDNKLELIELE